MIKGSLSYLPWQIFIKTLFITFILNTNFSFKNAIDIPGLMGSGIDYYPYVFFNLNLDFLENNNKH